MTVECECGLTWSGSNTRYLELHRPRCFGSEKTLDALVRYLQCATDEHGCLLPTSGGVPFGHRGKYWALDHYARRALDGRMFAHQQAYEFAHGPVPDGLTVSHECGETYENSRCVNVEHLFARTHAENHQRMSPAVRSRISSAGGLASPTSWELGHTPWNKGFHAHPGD